MKSGRASGLDHWTPGNWLNLPIEARQGIASILSECEKGLVWPHQVMPKRRRSPWASQRPMTGPFPSHHWFTLSMLKSENQSSLTLIVHTRLGGTLLLLGTLACVRVSGDGLCLKLPA